MSQGSVRHNPDIMNIVLLGGIGVIGVILLAKLSEGKEDTGTGTGVPPGRSRYKMAPTSFDVNYRLGDDMHIVWNFSHLGPSEQVILAFGVGDFSFLSEVKPFQTLEKTVTVNQDDQWAAYSIDHAWPLDLIKTRGFYDTVSYIRDVNGNIFDKKTSAGVIIAL